MCPMCPTMCSNMCPIICPKMIITTWLLTQFIFLFFRRCRSLEVFKTFRHIHTHTHTHIYYTHIKHTQHTYTTGETDECRLQENLQGRFLFLKGSLCHIGPLQKQEGKKWWGLAILIREEWPNKTAGVAREEKNEDDMIIIRIRKEVRPINTTDIA